MFAIARHTLHILPVVVMMVISVPPTAEARHWRHHGYYGYYGYYGQDRGMVQDREQRISPGASLNGPSISQIKSFGSAIEQMIRICEKQSVELRQTPFDRVSRAVRPYADQQTALDQIQHAVFESADALAAACPKDVPVRLDEKLDAVIKALKAMATSRATVRPAMVTFYGLLDEEQKARLVVHSLPEGPTKSGRDFRGNTNDEADTKPSVCLEWAAALRSWPTSQIETGVSLSDDQHAALHDITAQMYLAAGGLNASCPTEISLTPVGRVENDQKQLEALRRSVDGIQPVITKFENLLNDTQRARIHAVIDGLQEPKAARR